MAEPSDTSQLVLLPHRNPGTPMAGRAEAVVVSLHWAALEWSTEPSVEVKFHCIGHYERHHWHLHVGIPVNGHKPTVNWRHRGKFVETLRHQLEIRLGLPVRRFTLDYIML